MALVHLMHPSQKNIISGTKGFTTQRALICTCVEQFYCVLNTIFSFHNVGEFSCHYCRVFGPVKWGFAVTSIAPNSEWPVFPPDVPFVATEFIPECRFDHESCREVIEWTFPTKCTAPSAASSISCNVRLYHGGRKCEDLLVGEQYPLATETGGSFKVAIFADDLFRQGRRSVKLFEFGCEFMIEFRICTRALRFLSFAKCDFSSGCLYPGKKAIH